MKFADVEPGNWYELKSDRAITHGKLIWIPQQALVGRVKARGDYSVAVCGEKSGYVWHPSHYSDGHRNSLGSGVWKSGHIRFGGQTTPCAYITAFSDDLSSEWSVSSQLAHWDDLPADAEHELHGIPTARLYRQVSREQWRADIEARNERARIRNAEFRAEREAALANNPHLNPPT